MFFVHFEDGSIETEKRLAKWDNVPVDRKVKQVGVLVPMRNGGVLPLNPLPDNCDRYCCTKLGRAIVGGDNGKMIGYALMGMKDKTIYRAEVTAKGLGPLKILSADTFVVRGEAWRDGC